MTKFAFLVNNDGYKKYTYQAAKNAGASVPRIGIWEKLFEIHNAEPLNRYIELPFKRLWFKKVVDESRLADDEEIYFILYESFHMSFSRRLIKHYRRKYQKGKFVFLFTNPAGEYNLRRLERIRDLLDAVFSFNREDSERYGFKFLEADPFLLPQQDDYEPESDVFFIGADKGRLSVLLDVFERLRTENIKCDFWITDVPEEKQKHKDEIHYNQKISYEEVLKHDAHTRCILDVLQEGKSYSSIRTVEAIQYRKKVLTMSETVKDQWFYNPEIIQVFHKAEDIDPEFIRKKVDANEFDGLDLGSFQVFEELLLKAMKTEGFSPRPVKEAY